MRVLNLVVMMAFLWASTHVVVDHSGGGQRVSVFIPHVAAFDVHGDEDHYKLSDAYDPCHHDADAHTHFEWYIVAPTPDVSLHMMALEAIPYLLWSDIESFLGSAPAYRKALEHPPPRDPLYLRDCSLLA
jgi:hypothetical protein